MAYNYKDPYIYFLNVLSVDVEYLERPKNIFYDRILGSKSYYGFDSVKQITVKITDTEKYKQFFDSLEDNFKTGDICLKLYRYTSRGFEAIPTIFNFERDTEEITISRENIFESFEFGSTSYSRLDSFYINVVIDISSTVNPYNPGIHITQKIYEHFKNNNKSVVKTEFLRFNNTNRNIVLSIDDYNGAETNSENAFIVRARELTLVPYNIKSNIICNEVVYTEKDFEELDFNKIFSNYCANNSYHGYTYSAGIPTKYADRLPHSSLVLRPCHLVVNPSSLSFDIEGNSHTAVSQTLYIRVVVKNSAKVSKEAVAEFQRCLTCDNDVVKTYPWFHIDTHDEDGMEYTWNGSTFTQK